MSREQTTDVTALLARHPWIATAVADGDAIRVRPSRAAIAVRSTPGPLLAEFLEHWGEVYDFTYSTTGSRHAEDLDLSGWRASDTGEPFPVEHMADWVDRTVDLVLATRPRWVLELGCGTGLLAHRLRPHLAGYVGTDVAESAVKNLAVTGDASTGFVRAAAHELASAPVRDAMARAGFPADGPDCVLINSVTQHFPNVEYLTAVVVDALRLLAPGGVLIVGDVRHAGLLESYCRWVESSENPGAGLEERARARAERDDELNFDPATLAAAAAQADKPATITVHPKAMRADTELTRYRFDAVLRVDSAPTVRPVVREWTGLADLPDGTDMAVRVEKIPNRLLRGEGVTARELLDALEDRDAAVLLDPDDPAQLAVVAPASAAPVPVTEWAALRAHAHEPFTAFLTRRLSEVARTTMRRKLPGTAIPRIIMAADPLAAAARTATAAVDRDDVSRMPEFLDRLDQAALLAMAAMLNGPDIQVAPRHQWIVRRWLAALADRDPRPVSRTDVDKALQDIDRAREGLGYPPELTRFFRTAVQYLPRLLRDEVALQALLFADGETATAESAYRDNTINRYVNAAAAYLVRAHAETLSGPVRVLEVGAGVGGTTADVLAALANQPLDYLFTDVSRFFLMDAHEQFEGIDGVRFGLFDINGDLPGQGVDADRDVVLGANVLHNAHDIRATLRGLGDLLVPGGLLLFVETTREIPHILTSMQFLMSARPGHDRPGTRDRRAGTDRIFLTAADWEEELLAAGLEPLGCLPAPGHPLHRVGVQLFAAVHPLD